MITGVRKWDRLATRTKKTQLHSRVVRADTQFHYRYDGRGNCGVIGKSHAALVAVFMDALQLGGAPPAPTGRPVVERCKVVRPVVERCKVAMCEIVRLEVEPSETLAVEPEVVKSVGVNGMGVPFETAGESSESVVRVVRLRLMDDNGNVHCSLSWANRE